jgi:glycosyltransferase involved in cell wall biosynthesis
VSSPAPTISAVMTAYNAEAYIGEALTSILSQTLPPLEVIVVDDGSTDGTPAELERFGANIRIHTQTNAGHPQALNRAFGEARGDYVAKCDADDIWDSRKLERQAEAVSVHPEIDVAFGAARVFGDRDGEWAMSTADAPRPRLMSPHHFGPALYRSNPICPSTTIISRQLHERLGPFADSPLITEDYDYWMRALRAGARFYYDPEILVHYRRHDRNVSSDRLALHRSDYLVRSRNEDLIDDGPLVDEVIARNLFHIGRDLSEQGRASEARAALVKSIRRKPTLRSLAWMLLLSAPQPYGLAAAERTASVRRRLLPGVG